MKLKERGEELLLDLREDDGVENGVEAAVVDGVRLGVERASFAMERLMASRSSEVMSSSWHWSMRSAWPPTRLVM